MHLLKLLYEKKCEVDSFFYILQLYSYLYVGNV